MSKIQVITEDKDDGHVSWINDVEEFENPETLAGYLQDNAEPGTFKVDGYNISATPEAIEAAVKAYNEDAARAAETDHLTLY